jgi:hypothetical protein
MVLHDPLPLPSLHGCGAQAARQPCPTSVPPPPYCAPSCLTATPPASAPGSALTTAVIRHSSTQPSTSTSSRSSSPVRSITSPTSCTSPSPPAAAAATSGGRSVPLWAKRSSHSCGRAGDAGADVTWLVLAAQPNEACGDRMHPSRGCQASDTSPAPLAHQQATHLQAAQQVQQLRSVLRGSSGGWRRSTAAGLVRRRSCNRSSCLLHPAAQLHQRLRDAGVPVLHHRRQNGLQGAAAHCV